MAEKRIIEKTINFRWIMRNNKKILQQQFRESDRIWIDWKGDHPKYWWEDIPMGDLDENN